MTIPRLFAMDGLIRMAVDAEIVALPMSRREDRNLLLFGITIHRIDATLLAFSG
jgi:hypothetical protein